MGWDFEPSDPSVGIFGEGWFHDCGTETEALESPLASINRPHGETDFYGLLTCPDCVAQRIMVVRDYTGWDAPEDYETE